MAATPGSREEVDAFFASISPDVRTDGPISTDAVVDAALACKLHGYQRKAIAWAVARERSGSDKHGIRGGVLACEMGLGKTVETLGLLVSNPASSSDNGLLSSAASGMMHPLKSGQLMRSSLGSSAPAIGSCGACGRRLQVQEPIHTSADGWMCCHWCLLPQQPALPTSPPAAVVAPSEQGSQEGEHATLAAVEGQDAARPSKRVRFSASPTMGASPASAIALAAARRAALDDSRGIVADAQRQQPRAPYIVPESQRTGFKIRIKRPLGQGVGDAALAGIIAGGSTVGRLAASAATLVVTPASILRQWLQEIERHAPSLASRVLVYPGMRELGKRADARRLAQAMDRAYIVITTYRVLKQEVLYSGEDGDGADGSGGSGSYGDRFRFRKRYAVPSSPLLLRRFWRVVIDEAQAVQTKTATPSQLGAMAMRIQAEMRWCVTGTPLSPERGLIDGYDLLRFLGATDEVASSRKAFLAALNPGTAERDAVLAMLRKVVWRTSKVFAYAQLRIPAPVNHVIGCTLSSAERAWAARDVRDLLGGSEAAELPAPPLGVPELPPVPPERWHLLPPYADAASATAGASATADAADSSATADAADASATADSSPSPSTDADGSTPPKPVPRFELQRALSHVQLGRTWIGLGRTEAQLDTGTSIVDLEQLQRAAELVARRKQVSELELCEKLNLAASWHSALDEHDAARANYERVLRIEEWGIAEDASAGDQMDNAEETMRRWRAELCHTLFRLLCLHHNAGRHEEADKVSHRLRATEDGVREEADTSVRSFSTSLGKMARGLSAHLAALVVAHADAAGQPPRDPPPQQQQANGAAYRANGHPGQALPSSGWAMPLEHPPAVPEDAWLVRAAQAAEDAAETSAIPSDAGWLQELKALARAIVDARAAALRALVSGGEVAAGEDDGQARALQAAQAVQPAAPQRAGGEAVADAVGQEEQQQQQQEEEEEAEDAAALDRAEAEEAAAADANAAGEPAHAAARGRAAARAARNGGAQGVVDFWDVSLLERERRERQRRATATEYAALQSMMGVEAAQRLQRLEVVAVGEGERDVIDDELRRVRDRREAAAKEIQATQDAHVEYQNALLQLQGGGAEAGGQGGGGDGAMAVVERRRAAAAAHDAAVRRAAALRAWYDLLREAGVELGMRTQWALSRVAYEGGDRRLEEGKEPRALPERLASLPEEEQEDALRADLATLNLAIGKQARQCWRMEHEVASLYEQRERECRADREAQKEAKRRQQQQETSSSSSSSSSSWLSCSSSSDDAAAATSMAARVAAAAAGPLVVGQLAVAGSASLRRFLSAPHDRLARVVHETQAALAPHSCAVHLALTCAFARWLKKRVDEAVPAGSFEPASALCGTRPEQMRWKLDAVRYCAAQVGLRLHKESNELVASWLLREVPECAAVPCAIVSPPLPPLPPPAPGAQGALLVAAGGHAGGHADGHAGGQAGGGAPAGLPAQAGPPGALPGAAAALHLLEHAPPAAGHAGGVGAAEEEQLPVPARPRWYLPDGSGIDCVTEVEDEKEQIFDGQEMVPKPGELMRDGQVSGASYEPGPWTWDGIRRVWVRDTHPNDVLIATPCGHAYSERFFAAIMSTTIDRTTRGNGMRIGKARCCAPLPGGGSCQRVLSEAQALRVTGCRARGTRYLPPSCFPCARPAAAAASAPAGPISATALAAPPLVDVRSTLLHGSYGSRVDLVVRLLLALRREASRTDDPASCKCVIFSRHEPLLRLMDAACAMNGVSAARFGTSGHQHSEVATFLTDPTMQALLLSAQRDASGLTLTAASHVIICEPQPDVAVEQQMVGRVHRIGQTRQTHVHRVVISGTFEPVLASERLKIVTR